MTRRRYWKSSDDGVVEDIECDWCHRPVEGEPYDTISDIDETSWDLHKGGCLAAWEEFHRDDQAGA
jgi:hypothetical protein